MKRLLSSMLASFTKSSIQDKTQVNKRKFSPDLESLEDRLTPTTMMSPMTSAANTLAWDAWQNEKSLISLYNSAATAYNQIINHTGTPSLAVLESQLSQAKSLVSHEHSLANGMKIVEMYDQYYKNYAHAVGETYNNTQFRALDADFHQYDSWITTVAVPKINQMEALLMSKI